MNVLRYQGRVPRTLLVSTPTDLSSVSVNLASLATEFNVKVNGGEQCSMNDETIWVIKINLDSLFF